MKKIVLFFVCATMLVACDNFGKRQKNLQAQNDSLQSELAQKNAELEEMMETFNIVQEGFRLISEAEGRVRAQREGTTSSIDQVKEDMAFIAQTMKQNKEKIAELQKKLNNNTNASAQMKKSLDNLTAQLVEKSQELATLQAELAAKDIHIAELDETIAYLLTDVALLRADSVAKERILDAQDKALNTAWFVYGTKKELKEQNILEDKLLGKDEVLQSLDFNKDYFTQIDIRKDTEFKLYSKSAKLLTTHPNGSYEWTKDEKEQYILRVTNPTDFWSVSRYMVIQVK
jgi:chromosome segregation ATPase